MKKYLIALIPFVVCSMLAYIYVNMKPADYPDPTYPYRPPEMLSYLSSNWFVIGVVLSFLCFILLLIEDVFKFVDKKILEWQFKKEKKD